MTVPSSRGLEHQFVEHMTLGAVGCTQGRPVRPPLDDLLVFTVHLHLTTQILCMRDSIHSGELDGNSSWSTPPCIAVSSFRLACATSIARQQLNRATDPLPVEFSSDRHGVQAVHSYNWTTGPWNRSSDTITPRRATHSLH